MKKILLTVALALSLQGAFAQELLLEDCTALTVGNIGTDLLGTTPGQGGWKPFIATTAVPAGQNSDFQIVDQGGNYGKAIQITGASSTTGTRWLTKDMTTTWLTRTTGNDIAEVTFDFFTGPVTTSQNTMRVTLYESSAHAKMLGGIMVAMNTLVVSGLSWYDNAGTAGNYSFGLGASATAPAVLQPNTWYKMGFSYDFGTGKVIFREDSGVFNGFVNGAATGTDITEIDILAATGSTTASPNAAAATAVFDNINVTARATDSLLAIDKNDLIANNFSVAPNPATDIVTISNSRNILINTISIIDLNGRVVKSIELSNVTSSEINIADLSSGLYMMNVKSDLGTTVLKLIKK
jgi:hypothetical protein